MTSASSFFGLFTRELIGHAFIRPAKQIGGDLYDFFWNDESLSFCIGDVTGKGLQVRTSDFGAFCEQIAVITRDENIRLTELLPTDESLESVFGYLIAGASSSSAQGQGS